jgi:hypothetical protein
MLIKFQRGVRKQLLGRFGKYQFEVGILENKPHYQAQPDGPLNMGENLKTFAGGPARRQTRVPSGISVAEVSKENRARLGFNYLKVPFKNKSADIVKFSREFFKIAFGKSEKRRAENLLQAIVRNPILRGDYGGNTRGTAIAKGFDRHMIDTAQLFKSIRARCIVKGLKRV